MHTGLFLSKYDCRHFENIYICILIHERNDEKSTIISVCLKVVTLMWHMVYVQKKENDHE